MTRDAPTPARNDSTASDSSVVQPANKPAKRPSKLKRLCFRLTAVALPVLLVAIVEWLLIAFGVGDDLSLVVDVPGNPPTLRYQVNPLAEKGYFGGRELAGPEPRRFDLPRPEGVYRIVVVGGSTVLGFPYPSELAFPRQLEVLLNQQNTGETFEVINTGIIAINSFSVADIVKQSVAMEPDLIIVHTGHNEFYGPTGVASTDAVAPQAVYSLAVQARRTRLFQIVAGCFADDEANRTNAMESLPATVTISRSGPLFQQAESCYRSNLQRIVATASSAGIPVVLTTVASNLSGHSPVSFHVPEQLVDKDRQRWLAPFNRGRELAVAESWAEALEHLKTAKAISGDSSLLFFRMGQCLEGLERFDESREAFELARDIDGCRFRAPSSFGGIVRDVATQADQSQVFFVDTAERLATEVGPRALSSEIFLEHVHYNLVGHRRLATMLGRFVQTDVLRREWDAAKNPVDSELDALLGLLQEDRIAGLSQALRVMNVFPMNETFDAPVHRQELISKIKRELGVLDEARQQVFADVSLDDMSMRLAEALGDHYFSKGDFTRELIYRRCDLIRRPWNADVHFRAARCLADGEGEQTEAIRQCRRALALHPQHAAALRLLSTIEEGTKER
jgi:tetratricopeptide (TPR) repeat protein